MNDVGISKRKSIDTNTSTLSVFKSRGGKRRDQGCMVRDLVSCLALCHNVTPTYPDPLDQTIREFQASSPDEIALVKFADQLGMNLLERTQEKIVIKNTANAIEVR